MNYFQYWGKAKPSSGEAEPYHLLPYHCLDVAAVAYIYLGRHPSFRRHLMAVTGIDSEKRLLAWLAFWVALHDLGKFSEAFQGQRPDLFFSLRGREPRASKPYRLRHDRVVCVLGAGEDQCGKDTECCCYSRASSGELAYVTIAKIDQRDVM